MIKKFDILQRGISLRQSLLLEASAGTGKTFSIENIAVRLLSEEQIPLQNILVVSFTKATTAELKVRIRKTIIKTLNQLIHPSQQCPDYILDILEKGEKEIRAAKQKLRLALTEFDQAQIFTIHAFCKRMLDELGPLESFLGPFSKDQISTNQISQIIYDFFRVDLHEKKYSQGQLERILQWFKNDISILEKAIVEIVQNGSEIIRGKDIEELFIEFQLEMNSLKEKFCKEQILEEFLALVPFYNGVCDKKGNIKKEIFEEAKRFSTLFEQDHWTIGDFDWLLISGIPFFTYLDPQKIRKRVESPRSAIQKVLKSGLCKIVDEARDCGIIFSNICSDCKSRLKEFQEKEEKFRYDDFLLNMWKALKDDAFVEAVRKRYQAVIIDEFQDTDPTQWMIFKTIFLNHASLYLVGDPKQSIYAFRQADIYTYIEAKNALGDDRRASLKVNYRSSPSLVNALNTLFSEEHCKGLLILPKIGKCIPYDPIQPSEASLERTFLDGRGSIHFFIKEAEKNFSKQWPTEQCEQDWIFQYIINEIQKLKGKENVSFSDWAILVKDCYQAKQFIECCKEHQVPVRAQWQKKLCELPSYEMVKCLLLLLIHPNDLSLMKQFLIQPCCGWALDDLFAFDDTACASLKSKILSLQEQLFESGIASLLFAFLESTWKNDTISVLDRLLSLERGVEHIQEIKQLFEFLTRMENETKASPEMLYRQFCDLKEGFFEGDDSHFFKEDTSKEAVNVLTTHMSKGLEFPIVVALGLVKRNSAKHQKITFESFYKDEEHLYKVVSPENQKKLQEIALESDAEKMRLLYVAFTRAKYRLYVPVLIQKDAKKPLEAGESSPLELFLNEVVAASGGPEETFLEKIQSFLDRCQTHSKVSYEILKDPIVCKKIHSEIDVELVKPIAVEIPGKPHHIYSFTAMTKDLGRIVEDRILISPESEKNVFTLPLGKDTGIVVHKILEKIPFQWVHPEYRSNLLQEIQKFVQGTHLQDWIEVLEGLIVSILSQPMECFGKRFCFSDINPNKMYREIEFFYSFFDHSIFDKIQEFEIHPGYLRGLIDLIFEFEGQYFLVDWKTNQLGSNLEDFSQTKVELAMHANHYFFQEQIYREALRRFLKKVETRPFEICFGGSIYFFVRGANPTKVNSGIYPLNQICS